MNDQKLKIKKKVKKHIPKDWLCELRILYRLSMETFNDIRRTGIVNIVIITTMAAILTISGLFSEQRCLFRLSLMNWVMCWKFLYILSQEQIQIL